MLDELSDGRITIRRLKSTDVEALYEAVEESRAELGTWMTWCHPNYCMDDTRTWALSRQQAWEEGNEYNFIVTDTANGGILGTAGLNQINKINKFANLGYWVRTSATGKGIASSAARLVASFGLNEAGLLRAEIVVAVNNYGSQRAAEKAGAKREGVLRKRIIVHDSIHDAILYSLVSEDLQS